MRKNGVELERKTESVFFFAVMLLLLLLGRTTMVAAALPVAISGVEGWPMYGGTAVHSRSQPNFTNVRVQQDTRWVFKTNGWIYGAPCVGVDETVYASSWDGGLYAINATDGSQQWRYEVRRDEQIWSSPAVAVVSDSLLSTPVVVVYVGGNQSLLAITAPQSTGSGSAPGAWSVPTLKWAVKTRAPIFASPTVDLDSGSGTIYIGSLDGTFLAVEPTAGRVLWSFKAGGPIYASATLYAGVVYVATLFPGNVFALDAQTGAKKWSTSTSTSTVRSRSGASGAAFGMPLVAAPLPAVHREPATPLSAVRTYTSSPSMSLQGDAVFLADQEGRFVALNAETGAHFLFIILIYTFICMFVCARVCACACVRVGE